jgi:SAM-dependent methyltransferase
VQQKAVWAGLAAAGVAEGAKILEVGGGHGQLTEGFLRRGFQVWVQGSDASCFHLLEHLKSEFPQSLHFVVAPLWQLPFEAKNFDAVVAVRVLAHVENWRELVTEMLRLSRITVVIDLPLLSALNSLTPLLFGIKRKIEGNTRPYFSYSLADVSIFFAEQRSKILFMQREFVLPMGLHRVLGMAIFSRFIETVAALLGLRWLMGSPLILAASAPCSDSHNHKKSTVSS